MRTRKHYFGLLAVMAMAMAGCSDNDPTTGGESGEGGIQNATSYLAVNIKMADVTTSRATDGGFEDYTDTEEEHKVKTICALFFDKDGNYLTAGQKIESESPLETGSTTGNIESTVTPVITLGPTTISENNAPIKMLLFVNDQCPSEWKLNGTSVGEFSKLIGKSYKDVLELTTEGEPSKKGSFEMTNSAYVKDGSVVQAIEVDKDNFKTNSDDAKNNPVTAYVERTVAKVKMNYCTETQTVKNDANLTSNSPFMLEEVAGDNKKTYYYYPILNDNVPVSFTVDNKATAFAVKVLGWCANGVNTKGYLVKHINKDSLATTDESSTAALYKYWKSVTNNVTTSEIHSWKNVNDPDKYRSYWAEDVNYSDGTKKGTEKESGLTFKTEMPESTPKVEYIYENTVQQYIAQYKGGTQHPNVTTMLVSAQIVPLNGEFQQGSSTSFKFATVGNNETFSPVNAATTLIRYNGMFYTEEQYKAAALSDYYVATTEGGNTYEKITADMFKDNGTLSGLKWTMGTPSSNTTGKSYNGVTYTISNLGTCKIYSESNGSYTETDVTALNNAIKSAFESVDYFKDGKCFYQVPIEHPVGGTATDADKIYGVVRNHSYVLTLNSISNIGAPNTGKEEEEEKEDIELIPGQDQYYYLGCTLNVLAWRKVNQTVQL